MPAASRIPAVQRPRVFESRFTASPDGAGFGQVIVEEVANVHGWTATPADADTGARFEVRDVEFVDG